MTFEQFNLYQDSLLAQVVEMKDTKGKEYANSQSRFANFDRLASQLEVSREKVAWVYVTKHLDSISYAIKNSHYSGLSESFESRIIDAITYLTLIAGMVKEHSNSASS